MKDFPSTVFNPRQKIKDSALQQSKKKTDIDERTSPMQCYVCGNFFKANHSRMISSTHFIEKY
jgi:hypothetical protein